VLPPVAAACVFLLWSSWSVTSSGQRLEGPVDVFVACAPHVAALLEGGVGVVEPRVHWALVDRIDDAQILLRPEERGTAHARAWIDCSRPYRVRVYFASWDTERFLVRDVPLPSGWTEIARESMAQLIESSIKALGSDGSIGMSRTEMASMLRPEPAVPVQHPQHVQHGQQWGMTWGAFYAVQAFSQEQWIEQGPGLMVTVDARRGQWMPGAWVSAQYQLPQSITTDVVGVHLDTVALRAGARVTRELGRHTALALQLGAGADLIQIEPRQGSGAQVSLASERFSAEFAGQVALAATLRPSTQYEFCASLLADVDFGMRHYDLVVDGATRRVFTPLWIRPGILVGVAWR
jgi:hypothetical protein